MRPIPLPRKRNSRILPNSPESTLQTTLPPRKNLRLDARRDGIGAGQGGLPRRSWRRGRRPGAGTRRPRTPPRGPALPLPLLLAPLHRSPASSRVHGRVRCRRPPATTADCAAPTRFSFPFFSFLLGDGSRWA